MPRLGEAHRFDSGVDLFKRQQRTPYLRGNRRAREPSRWLTESIRLEASDMDRESPSSVPSLTSSYAVKDLHTRFLYTFRFSRQTYSCRDKVVVGIDAHDEQGDLGAILDGARDATALYRRTAGTRHDLPVSGAWGGRASPGRHERLRTLAIERRFRQSLVWRRMRSGLVRRLRPEVVRIPVKLQPVRGIEIFL